MPKSGHTARTSEDASVIQQWSKLRKSAPQCQIALAFPSLLEKQQVQDATKNVARRNSEDLDKEAGYWAKKASGGKKGTRGGRTKGKGDGKTVDKTSSLSFKELMCPKG